MSNKSFSDRRSDQHDEIGAFWATTQGLATGLVILALVAGTFVWNVVASLIG